MTDGAGGPRDAPLPPGSPFPPRPGGLTTAEAEASRAQAGANEVPEPPPHPLRALAGRFGGPVAWMLEAALVIELGLGKAPEAVIIAALLVFNALLAQFQERRAEEALRLLRHRLRVSARVLRDGMWSLLPAREVVPGDRIHLRMGDIVPADGRIVDGQVEVDQSTITGESAAASRGPGETLFSSSIVQRGEASADVIATGTRTFYGKTAELVRSAKAASHLERLLFEVVRYLVTLDTLLAVVVLTIGSLRGVSLTTMVPFVLILLIASVPAAMPATFTIANALESRRLVDRGVLVTELSAVQDAASMDLLCADKTGTLTEGRETLGDLVSLVGDDDRAILALAGAACDESTQDTIDLAVLAEARRRGVAALERTRFLPFDPALKRSEAWIRSADGPVRVVLGSPSVVADLCERRAPGLEAAMDRLAGTGARVLAVASGPEGHLSVAGLLALADPPRSDAAALIGRLGSMGVRVVLLTGDTTVTARTVARRLGLGDHLGDRSNLSADPSGFDGFAGIYPEDKYRLVRAFQAQGHIVGMTGDGVNDAPALKQAEVGIAVASATDVARASAKLVLTRPGLSNIVDAIEGGRMVYRRMLTWTLNKISKNFEQVFLLTFGFLITGVFVTSPFLILLMVFANDFVSMSVGTDNARISTTPDRWHVREIAALSAVIASGWLVLSFSLLAWALAVAHLAVGTLQTLFFVYLVFSSQTSLLLLRETGHAWASRPHPVLVATILVDGLAVSLLALTGTLMSPLPAALLLFVLGLVLLTAAVLDQVKVAFLRWSGAFGPRSRFARGKVPGATRSTV
jgi:H+-transporting ATPase